MLDGEEIRPDEPVLVSIEAANRDAATFEHPDDFDLQRERPRDHVSFGSGAHICPGAFLARLEGRVVVISLPLQPGSARPRSSSSFSR